MTKGYVCVVQNNKETNYLDLAYYLALSIKSTQTIVNKLSIITDIDVPLEYQPAFDKIIVIKNDRANNSEWKLHNIVDLYDYTPYDETVILDSDMLFLTDVSHWWDIFNVQDMWFTSHIKNHRGEFIDDLKTIYRQEFLKNQLPSIYMAFTYFKKSELAESIFNEARNICENWDEYCNTFLINKKPKVFSTDVAFALAIQILGVKNQVINPVLDFPYFIHMKTENQNWNLANYKIYDDWSNYIFVGYEEILNQLSIIIGGTRQQGILHYHVKTFLDDNMKRILEQAND